MDISTAPRKPRKAPVYLTVGSGNLDVSDYDWIDLDGWGAGGGGADKNSGPIPFGGTSGPYARKLIDVRGIDSIAWAVGSGGQGGQTDGAAGSAGGTTSFGAYLTLPGGPGGNVGSAGGVSTPSGGDFQKNGNPATTPVTGGGYPIPGGGAPMGGEGGAADMAYGGRDGVFPGGGGQGGNSTPGGDGADGLLIVRDAS